MNKGLAKPKVLRQSYDHCAIEALQMTKGYLQGTSSGNSFVSVQCSAQFLPEEFADSLFDSRDPGSSAHYLDCIDVFFFQFLWD